MKNYILILLITFKFYLLFADNNVIFFVETALQNNPKLNACIDNCGEATSNIQVFEVQKL